MTTASNSVPPEGNRPLRIGIIGMGGFAGTHHDMVLALEQAGQCKLVCTCDPDPGAFMDKMGEWSFAKREVMVFDHYLDMLDACAGAVDIVTIPTPVPLHAEMHRACIERGLAVYLEKPPTLNIHELEDMLAVEAGATKETNVGFNYIVEVPRQALKLRLLRGEFGSIRKVSLAGVWPRISSYYQRANWAGKLMLNGKLVLDSGLGNAMAHYAHNILFWAGQNELFDWSTLQRVRAELYRAHAIQGTDTLFIDATADTGLELKLALTHACDGPQRHWERVTCDDATITYVTNEYYEIRYASGKVESQPVQPVTLYENLVAYLDYMRGGAPHPLTRLVDARPFVELNDLAYIASQHITTIPAAYLTRSNSPDEPGEYVAINGIDEIVDRFLSAGQFPSEQALSWARPGSEARHEDLKRLESTVKAMVAEGG